ncbi:MAG TPA: RNA polymerase sigma factor [Clostridia bacterium]|nr:RNA polymerase sigma factor [Clostridia bacterium]
MQELAAACGPAKIEDGKPGFHAHVMHQPVYWFPKKIAAGQDAFAACETGPACVIFPGTVDPAEDSYKQEHGRGALDFQAVVEAHYAPLFRFAMSLTRTENDAADLVQGTFLVWATKGHQLQDQSRVKSWLFTTLHRRFLETERRGSRFPHQEISEVAGELPILESNLVDHLDAQQAVELLSQVDPQFKAAVALFYLEDYSYPEIARILEVPLGTVKSRISRGIGQLRTLLLRRAETIKLKEGA